METSCSEISPRDRIRCKCVAADVCRTSDVLTQTVELLGEHVDGVRVELAGDDPWHVEFADDDYKNLY